MKVNKIEKKRTAKGVLAVLGVFIGIAALVGLAIAYGKLRDLWLEQCVITDVTTQVSVTDGKMVRADTVAMEFGLKNGANVALIDFKKERERVMKKIPHIRNLTVTRHLPNRVSISIEERVPVARMNIRGSRAAADRVVDTDGVVFPWKRGTQTLPTIREAFAPGTPNGNRITGRTLAALRLLETSAEKFPELNILAVDVSKTDFLLATLGNYSELQIAWEGMDDPSEATEPALVRQLDCLSKAYNTRITDEAGTWIATQPGKVSFDNRKGHL